MDDDDYADDGYDGAGGTVIGAPDPARAGLQVDRHLWRHALESGSLAITATLLAAVVMPASWPLPYFTLGAVVAAGGLWTVTMAVTGSAVLAAYLCAWGVLIASWFTVARILGPWHAPVVAGLLIPGVLLCMFGAPAIGHHRRRVARLAAEAQNLAPSAPIRVWQNILARHGAPGVTVKFVREFEDGGLEVHGRLGKATEQRRAITFDELSAHAGEIAVSRRRDPDGVYFTQPENGSAADFILHVRAKRLGARAPVHLPAENKLLSINLPLHVGVTDNKRPFPALLREVHVTIFGVTRSGKSNLINVFLALLACCPDALIWMIDMKGGRTSRPWVTPWLQGFTPRPVIDWVATTREETKLMLETALLAVRTRATYPGFEKILPNEDVPQLVMICDDVSACFGHGKREGGISNYGLSQLGAEFTELAGSEAGMLIGAGQRANVEQWGGTGMKAQSELRFALRATSISDAQSIFPGAGEFQAAKMLTKLRDKGDCLVRHGPELSPVVHLYRVGSEERITDRALWAGEFRPEPEPALVRAMGEAYENRWTRNSELLDAWRDAAGIKPPPDEGDEFTQIITFNELDTEADIDPRWAKLRELYRAAGWRGIKTAEVLDLLAVAGKQPPRRETVQRWLERDEQMGLVTRGNGRSRDRWCRTLQPDDDELPGAG